MAFGCIYGCLALALLFPLIFVVVHVGSAIDEWSKRVRWEQEKRRRARLTPQQRAAEEQQRKLVRARKVAKLDDEMKMRKWLEGE